MADNIPPIDFAADAEQGLGVASDAALKQVSELAERQVKGEAYVAALDAQLKQAKELLRNLTEVQLPDAMDAAGLKEFTLSNGTKVKVDRFMTASISAERMPQVAQWLRENGHDGLVQRVMTVSLAKGQDAEGERIIEALRAIGVLPKDESKVNTTSIKAWAKELIEGGATLPLELFGIYMGRRSVIK